MKILTQLSMQQMVSGKPLAAKVHDVTTLAGFKGEPVYQIGSFDYRFTLEAGECLALKVTADEVKGHAFNGKLGTGDFTPGNEVDFSFGPEPGVFGTDIHTSRANVGTGMVITLLHAGEAGITAPIDLLAAPVTYLNIRGAGGKKVTTVLTASA